jgi:hypothetical protein
MTTTEEGLREQREEHTRAAVLEGLYASDDAEAAGQQRSENKTDAHDDAHAFASRIGKLWLRVAGLEQSEFDGQGDVARCDDAGDGGVVRVAWRVGHGDLLSLVVVECADGRARHLVAAGAPSGIPAGVDRFDSLEEGLQSIKGFLLVVDLSAGATEGLPSSFDLVVFLHGSLGELLDVLVHAGQVICETRDCKLCRLTGGLKVVAALPAVRCRRGVAVVGERERQSAASATRTDFAVAAACDAWHIADPMAVAV